MSTKLDQLTELAKGSITPGQARGVLREEPNAVILHVRVCEGRSPCCYGEPTRAGSRKRRIRRDTYAGERSSPARKHNARKRRCVFTQHPKNPDNISNNDLPQARLPMEAAF